MTVQCALCGAEVNFIELHLTEAHSEMTIDGYRRCFPEAPVMSKEAEEALQKRVGMLAGNERITFDIGAVFGIRAGSAAPKVSGWIKPWWNTPTVDPDYVFDKELLTTVLYAMEAKGKHLLLSGPTGSGKTSVVEQVAARLNRPVYRMNFDGDITRAEFVGQMLLKSGHHGSVTDFQYGILPTAMREGAVLILDEIDAGDPSVTMALQGPLDGAPLTLLETGETIKAHPDFRVFATANTVGQGDETGLYNGTQPQNYATLNRFKLVELVDYQPASVEKKIIQAKTGVTNEEGLLDKLTEVAKLIRTSHKRQEMVGTMSTRTLIETAETLLAFGDIKRAYRLTFLNSQNSEDRKVAEEIIQRVWGE